MNLYPQTSAPPASIHKHTQVYKTKRLVLHNHSCERLLLFVSALKTHIFKTHDLLFETATQQRMDNECCHGHDCAYAIYTPNEIHSTLVSTKTYDNFPDRSTHTIPPLCTYKRNTLPRRTPRLLLAYNDLDGDTVWGSAATKQSYREHFISTQILYETHIPSFSWTSGQGTKRN